MLVAMLLSTLPLHLVAPKGKKGQNDTADTDWTSLGRARHCDLSVALPLGLLGS